MVPAAAARLRTGYPGVELLLAEAEPQGALRMLRAGRVDVALVFSYLQHGTAVVHPEDEEGVRARLLLDEPVHLVTSAGSPVLPRTTGNRLVSYAEHRWIAGCERCRSHLIWQCERAGFTPQIAFTTDDVLVAQALAASGLGVALLPDLALRAARHPGIRAEPLPGARRQVLALTYGEPPGPPAVERLLDALTEKAEGRAAGAAARR
jgi:DNA-binding transcriptional LysR family regulator